MRTRGTLKEFESFPDSIGQDTRVGDKVVYNLSGTLAVGHVTEIKVATDIFYKGTNYERYYNRWQIRIKCTAHARTASPGKKGISKVTGVESIVNVKGL